MKTTVRKDPPWVVITVDGNIMFNESEQFTELLLRTIREGDNFLVIDLAACDFICSSGLGAIAAALMVARSRGGDMEIAGADHNIRNLFHITQLENIVTIRNTDD